jgi:catechol 2,3-dioxygenase-like lactoylglutathione lyase family enzyme
MKSVSAVKALGEIALRVNNLERMKRFYQEVLGFEVLGEFPTAALLKIASGYAGPGNLIVRCPWMRKERLLTTSLSPLAFPDYDCERKRLETLGLNVEVQRTPMGQLALALLSRSRRQPSRTGLEPRTIAKRYGAT